MLLLPLVSKEPAPLPRAVLLIPVVFRKNVGSRIRVVCPCVA